MHKGGACGGTGAFFYFAHKKRNKRMLVPPIYPKTYLPIKQ